MGIDEGGIANWAKSREFHEVLEDDWTISQQTRRIQAFDHHAASYVDRPDDEICQISRNGPVIKFRRSAVHEFMRDRECLGTYLVRAAGQEWWFGIIFTGSTSVLSTISHERRRGLALRCSTGTTALLPVVLCRSAGTNK